MALLTTETFGFGDRYSLYADVLKGFLNLVEFERLDNGFDFFHGSFVLPCHPYHAASMPPYRTNNIACGVPRAFF